MASGSEGSSYHTRSLSEQEATDASFACPRSIPCLLRRRIPVPREKRIRTLPQDLDGDALDGTRALQQNYQVASAAPRT